MARRGCLVRERTIDLTLVVDAFWRLLGALVLETLAFVVWNVGTRSPLRVLRDVRASLRDVRAFVTGLVCALVGFIFIAAATVLLLPAIADPPADFIPVEIGTLLIALATEHLIGNDLRTLAGARRQPNA
ncbi:MAG: hypothetical protein M3R53_06675 [Candidatus Eremiobacteraeota bacterium]|nr:hypothetical protein [Candidatus Eremiobacteraeota bacterium]